MQVFDGLGLADFAIEQLARERQLFGGGQVAAQHQAGPELVVFAGEQHQLHYVALALQRETQHVIKLIDGMVAGRHVVGHAQHRIELELLDLQLAPQLL